MKGYCTKYALTKGIFEVNAEPPSHDEGSNYVYTKDPRGYLHIQMRRDVDFFEDREAAEYNACQRAKDKITSLHRQIAKLAPLTTAPKWGKL